MPTNYLVEARNKNAWQQPVVDKDLTTSPAANKGDRYIIAGTGGQWSGFVANDIVYCSTAGGAGDAIWQKITPSEGWRIYIEDENLWYFYNGSAWQMEIDNFTLKHINGRLKLADRIELNTMLNAFRIAINGSLSQFNMVDGITDEYEDETGIDTVNSLNEDYDSVNDLYKPTSLVALELDYIEYATDEAAQAAYVTDAPGGIVWTERQPAGDVSKNWRNNASDADGSHLIAAVENGRLWTSSDYGVTWTERRPAGDVDKAWNCVDSDSDGSHLIAGVNGGRLYTSSDYGANWTERRPAGDVDKAWRATASDDDGSNLIAGITVGGRLYTSSDYGANWTERRPAGDVDKAWYGVDSDADGSNLIVGCSPGRLYTSADSGANWTERTPAGAVDKGWQYVASDSDGSNLIVAYVGGRVYTSSDSGANWTERTPAGAGDKSWYGVASDADGSFLMAVNGGFRLYSSSDYGVNWIEQQPMGAVDTYWWVASDDDGSNLIAGRGGSRLFTGVEQPSGLQCYSESSIKNQGDYSLKVIADITDSLNKTLTKSGLSIDLSGRNELKIDFYASRTGTNIQLKIHDSGGTTSTKNITISVANTWETTTWDISAIADVDKDNIDSIIIEIINADSANTFYVDNFYSPALTKNMTLISNSFTAEAQPDTARIVLFEEDVDSIIENTDLKAYISRDGGTTYSQVTLADEGDYQSGKRILTGTVDISGQPAGTSMEYKIETLNNKNLKLHGVGELWD